VVACGDDAPRVVRASAHYATAIANNSGYGQRLTHTPLAAPALTSLARSRRIRPRNRRGLGGTPPHALAR